MTPEHVEAARRLAKETWDSALVGTTYRDGLVRIVEALDRAGMLRTGMEKRAIATCELNDNEHNDEPEACLSPSERSARAVALALKQPPKPRSYHVAECMNGAWVVSGPGSIVVAGRELGLTESQATAIAAALNACDTEAPNA